MTNSHSFFISFSAFRGALARASSTAAIVGVGLLLSCVRSWGQPISCATAIENATVVIPDTVSVTGAGSKFFSPDSVAVFSSEEACVGVAQWPNANGTALTVAGSIPFEKDGLEDGDPFYFRLYNAYGEQHWDGSGTFVKCERLTRGIQDLCRDEGRYEDDAVYVLQTVHLGPSSASGEPGVQNLELSAPYPNPTQGPVNIRFATPKRQKIELKLYDALGRVVRTLGDGEVKGRQGIQVDLSGLASGAYFLRLRSRGKTRSQRITVVR